jgi:histidinol-phosphate aminotransferase
METKDVLRLIKPEVLALEGYRVAIPPHTIKLNQNESPWDLPEAIKEASLERLRSSTWSRYPRQVPEKLHAELRKSLKLPVEIDILVGNGSNELIQTLLMATIERGAEVVIPVPTFTLYRLLATVLGAAVLEVELKEDLTFDTERILEVATHSSVKAVVLCRPNNPTGTAIPLGEVKRIASETNVLLLVDEAYHDFANDNVLRLLFDHENLVILRTFSKALRVAGLRIGYMLGHAPLITQVGKTMLPFNVSIPTEEAALAILENKHHLQEGIQMIIEGREMLYQQLKEIKGIMPFPSQANFICFRTKVPAPVLFDALLERGILVRNVSHYPMLSDCLRVSVGTDDENRVFINVLKGIMEER